ncbi:MAG TPA: PTS sugar transporter subunit IIA [Opitutus sp.]|nr:PTS sugar transporter subunit IIA [Opitutus sp.]
MAGRLPWRNVKALTELIAQPDVVMPDLSANSREAALRAMHEELARVAAVTEPALLLRDLLERALVASVCIAPDVALPHARTAAVQRIVMAVARVRAPGVGFDAEHPNVRLVFMIGTPREQVAAYLELVARITRLLRTDGVRPELMAAATEAEFRQCLARGAER